MRTRSGLLVAVIAVLAPATARAQTRPAATTLEAALSLSHTMQDMLDFLSHDYTVDTSLRVAPTGAAVFELRGRVRVTHSRIPYPPSPGVPPPGPPREEPMADRWTGTARWVGTTLEVHFDRAEAWQPPVNVDLVWRCVPVNLTVRGAVQPAYQCATDQHMTAPSGPGYHLPPYFQVPLPLALPAARLRATIHAHGGADHHATPDSMEYERR